MRKWCVVVFALAAAFGWANLVQAKGYPARPITLIVSFAAGGPSDTAARLAADHMSRTLGEQIIIENVPGAGGTAGAERAAKAAPDGYTILFHHGALTRAPALYSNLRYDTKAAFETIGLINRGPMIVVSRKSLEARSAAELFDYLKKNADKVSLGHAGVGSNSYTCGLLLQRVLNQKLAFVAYRGTGPAMNDLVAGQIDAMCDQATNAVPQITAGTIKAYAITGDERIESVKEVPTSTEAGFPGLKMEIWNALYVPRGTPRDVVKTLNAALQKALEDKTLVDKLIMLGTTPFPKSQRSPEAHRAYFLADLDVQARLLQGAGIKAVEAKD
ncbi:MAG TPA: tripartite tricarboxylate transporter substrate-binding protein [Hyphomicrobiaceae bacterium]|nr:tripartite tricarboxylate transporter substrate-binding protein [Hyphomicrobiaceae bacterium]